MLSGQPDIPMRKIRIAVVAFNDILPFHLSVPCGVFQAVLREKTSPFRLRVCSAEGKRLRSASGFVIATDYGLDELRNADIVIVPSWRDTKERPPEALLDALRLAAARCKRIFGLCMGAFVLGHAGLLDGRRATTHWFATDDLAALFPTAEVGPDVLYVDAGQVVTSAGAAAGIDCCLHLVRQLLGSEHANRIARRMVVSPFRHGGQAQFIEQPVPAMAGDVRMAKLLDEIRGKLRHPHSLDEIAARTAMSRRSFTRHFRQLTGSSFGDWLMSQRLSEAQRLLETTSLPLDRIAGAVGLGSPVTLRQHFQRAFRTSPTSYRRTFNAARGED